MAIQEISLLEKSAFNKQKAFIYLACERLYPNYIFFSTNFDFGNPSILRNGIEYLYDHLFKNEYIEAELTLLIDKVNLNAPEPAGFSTILASSALDACGSIIESLYYILDKNFERIENISTYATDSVDMYIQDIEDLDFNTDQYFQQKIDTHPLMKREKDIQTGIIKYLDRAADINYDDITMLLQMQSSDGKGNLGL